MPVYIVAYDTNDNDSFKAVRKGTFVSQSVYLFEHKGPARGLAKELLVHIGVERGVADLGRDGKFEPDKILQEGENLSVIGAGSDWVAHGDSVDEKALEKVLGRSEK